MSCVATYGWYAAVMSTEEAAGLGIAAGGIPSIGGDSCEELGAMPELGRDANSQGDTVVETDVERDSATCVVLMVRMAVLPRWDPLAAGGASARWSSHSD